MLKKFLYIIFFFSLTLGAQTVYVEGAVGAGKYVSGGEGGTVLHVTNLNWNSSAGSLLWALEQTYPRVIVFDVSGTIDATSESAFVPIINGTSYDDVTIAGQTAPGEGITIRTSEFMFQNMDNIIIENIRFRASTSTSQDVMWLLNCSNVLVKNCTFAFGGDESMSISGSTGTSGNVTIQDSFFQDSSTGTILGVDQVLGNFTYAYNATANISHRFPNPKGNGHYDIFNNVVYNWKNRLVRITYEGTYNVVNNYYKPSYGGLRSAGWFPSGVSSTYMQKLQTNASYFPEIYTAGNIIWDQRETPQTDDSDMWTVFAGSHLTENDPVPSTYFVGTAHAYNNGDGPAYTGLQTIDSVLARVGARHSLNADGTVTENLDSRDSAYITMIQNDTYSGSFYDTRATIGVPTITGTTKAGTYDTDSDGMGDAWETATFGDLTQTASGDFDADGISNLREFLNLAYSPAPVASPGQIIKARGGRVRVNGKFMRIKTN